MLGPACGQLRDAEAEQALIGSILLNNQATMPIVCSIIDDTAMLMDARNRIIFDAVASPDGTPCDLVTMNALLKDRSRLKKAGGSTHLDDRPAGQDAGRCR